MAAGTIGKDAVVPCLDTEIYKLLKLPCTCNLRDISQPEMDTQNGDGYIEYSI